jgi:hypothetical protein
MGAFGSTRWGLHGSATTVEDCRVLDLLWLARQGAFIPGHTGTVRWSRGEKEVASLGYAVRPSGGGLTLWLSYRWRRAGSAVGEAVEIPVPLETTRPHFGGVRWWGRCPLVVNGTPCNRRIGKLYLTPGGRYFGCRRCHGLTYTSCQESHKHDGLYRHIAQNLGWDPADVKRTMNQLGKRKW